MKKEVSFILLLFFLFFSTTLQHLKGNENDDNKQKQEKNIGDVICGPKCVREILRWYKKEDEDIVRLVREIQYPEIWNGAALDKVAAALEKRKIHTFSMKIKPSARLVWQYPVIVHLNPKPGEIIGHYVVWLPNSHDNSVQIYDGDKGIQEYGERTWSKERSGAVLLTSLKPIEHPGKAVMWVGLPFYDYRVEVLSWTLFIIGIVLSIESFCFHRPFRKGKML